LNIVAFFSRRLLSRFHVAFSLSKIFPTYNSCMMSRLLRAFSFISNSPSLPTPTPFLSLSLSLFCPWSFTPHLHCRLSRPIQRDDWRIDSSREVQSGLRHRVCVFQKCWRRLSRRSLSPSRVSIHLLLDLPLSSPFSISHLSLSLFSGAFSSSQNQWVECSRSSACENPWWQKSIRAKRNGRDRRIISNIRPLPHTLIYLSSF